jgi:SEC-C motif domain protein
MKCYCGSTKAFDVCCAPFISSQAAATSCEQLMRSRYSAYCHKAIDYIYNTYHHSVQANNPKAALAAFAYNSHFIALQVLCSEQHEQEGYVSFNIKYLQQNMLCEFSERSRFIFNGEWYYVDGILTETAPVKIARNNSCPCNSGKKFKQCTEHRLSGN